MVEDDTQSAAASPLASDSYSVGIPRQRPYPNIDAFHDAWATEEGDGMWLEAEGRVRIWLPGPVCLDSQGPHRENLRPELGDVAQLVRATDS